MQTRTGNDKALRFGFGATRLEIARVAAGSRGIATILLGSDRQDLQRRLAAGCTSVPLAEDKAGLVQKIAKVVAFADAPRAGPDLALDLRGSELELAVWVELRSKMPGATLAYGTIARSLPMPATAQEVAASCAASRLAVAVPCHRVVKGDGSISGYRWGVHRKRRFIDMERNT